VRERGSSAFDPYGALGLINTDYNEESFFVRHAYFPLRQRSLCRGENHLEGGNQRRSLGDAAQRHLAAVRPSQNGAGLP
jgi:hypothetical protein